MIILAFLLIIIASVPIEGKCSRLPSGKCWVNCMEDIFDVICNSVSAAMVHSDISVFADTSQELRLYIWSSPNITRLSADIFHLVASQILTIDLQDLTALDTFPEVYGLVNLRRLSVWNSPKLVALSLELLPRSLYRIALNKIGLSYFINNFANIVAMPNLQQFVLRNLTIKGWQNDFLKVFPRLTLLEISNSTIDVEDGNLSQEADLRRFHNETKVETISTLKFFNNGFTKATKDASIKFSHALLASITLQSGENGDVDISMNNMSISSDMIRGGLMATAVRINMRGNSVEGATGMFEGFTQLTELDMSRTKLLAMRGMFSGLPALHSLKLHHNNLQNLSQIDIFEGSQSFNLTYLDLSYNDIHILPALNSLVRIASQVTYLNLQGNRLQLFLSNTSWQFENQHAGIAAFSRLETLILSHNRFSVFHGFHLAPLTRLKVLDISCNPLEVLRKEAFTDLPSSLVDVDVSMCIRPPKLPPRFEKDAFTTMPPIRILRMRASAYKKSIFSALRFSRETTQSLEELYMDDNDMTALLNNSLPRLPNLRILGLSRNKLQSVQAGLFAGLPNLLRLNLKANRIGSIGANEFTNSHRHLQQLEELDISDNGLYQIHRGAFDGLPKLRSLMLGWNPTEIQGIFESGGRRLEYLGIQGYNHSCLKPEFFEQLPRLRWILPDIYNLVLANPDDRLNRRDEHLISLLQVCEVGPDVPDHETYPGLKQYVGVTIHDTDEGDGVQYPLITAFLPLNYCPVDDYVQQLGDIICTSAITMDH
ncbi:hypothetical protein BV898_17192 [Hypsibius exemplaris]|uniref:Insulin-like growth factor-binding protein complex acid labile subunit n=1 Tax=Hypsibius exemplaris TaxID=2072580 RepID=A0A9X6NN79_HYPEX|nr:hypothetical protein BV898_17192 [Hypsibius exemplaris]